MTRPLALGPLAAMLALSCASVIGVDGYQDAADVLCKCDVLSFKSDCTRFVQRRLDDAKPEQRQSWLEAFDKKNCGTDCTNALACYDTAPVCSPESRSCKLSRECCAYGDGGGCCKPEGGNATCCEACQTCAELVAGGPDAIPACDDSKQVTADLISCITTQCPAVCNTGKTEAACQQCLAGKCAAAYTKCSQDVRL